MSNDLGTILAATVPLSVPLAFAGVGECIAEQAGTLNISVEGMMLAGAYFGALGSSVTHSATLGILWGVLAGLVVAAMHANLSHRIQANTFVVGLTLNILVLGLTDYLSDSSSLLVYPAAKLTVPLLSAIPVTGKPLFVEPWPAYLLVVVIPAAWYVTQRRRLGLEFRSVGENPRAADVSGVRVNVRRRQALMICGVLSGLGGAYLSVCQVGAFTTDMSAGRGYIVIAAVIFGGWKLRGVLAGCLLFGVADALQLALPAMGVNFNGQLIVAAPYLLALIAVSLFAKRQRQPAELSQPFERGAA